MFVECSFLHYVIIVKVKKFESVERECDDLDVGLHAMIVLLILTIAFRSPATIVFPLLPRALATLGGGLKGERHTHNKQV